MKTGFYYGIVACTKSRVRCAFCGVFIPNANKCIEEHINGTKHKEIMDTVNENGIYYTTNVGLHCNVCKTVVPENESIAQHLQVEDHFNWLARLDELIDGEFINVSGFLSNRTVNAYCEPCRVNIPCTLQSIEAHVYDPYHHINVTESVKPLNGLFPAQNDNELWCKVCDLYLQDTLPDVMAHAEYNDRHVGWFTQMEQFTDENDIFLGNYLSHEYENKVYCQKCRCEILATAETINYHVNSEEHQSTNLPYIVEGDPQSLFYYNQLP